MIQIADLQFAYPKSFFQLNIDRLEFREAQTTAVVGSSGSGKTTLLHLIAGILLPDKGEIRVGGSTLTKLSDSERRRFRLTKVGFIFQEFELIEYLNVVDNVLLAARIDSAVTLTPQLRSRAVELLETVGLKKHAKKSIIRLSQGERQRVAICRALLLQPKLILADEPTGNLDPVTSNHILDLLFAAVRAESSTLVMVTHDHSLLHRFDETVDFAQFLSSSTGNLNIKNAAAGDVAQ